MVIANSVVCYSAIYLFQNISNHFLWTSYNLTNVEAGKLVSFFSFISAIQIPFFGILFDWIGYKGYFVLLTSFLIMLTHFSDLAIGECDKCIIGTLPMIFFTLAFSLYDAALYPLLNSVVQPSLWGTAFGIHYSFLNLGMAIGASFIGFIQNNSEGNKALTLTFLFEGSLCVITTVAFLWMDYWKTGGKLNQIDSIKRSEYIKPSM
jgi:MFS family permease